MPLAFWQVTLKVDHTDSVLLVDTPQSLSMSESTRLHAALDWAPNSSLHAGWLDSFSVEDVILIIKGDHLSSVVVSYALLPNLVVSSDPFGSLVVSLSDSTSVLHPSVRVNAPDIFRHTVDESMGVGILSLVFNLEPVSSHLDSLVIESSPF